MVEPIPCGDIAPPARRQTNAHDTEIVLSVAVLDRDGLPVFRRFGQLNLSVEPVRIRDHHRSVLSFAGEPDAVVEAAFRTIRVATDLIDAIPEAIK